MADMACTEEKLLTVVLNISCQKGWITENEKLRIKTTRTFNDKKMALLHLMKTMDCDDNAARLLLSMRCIEDMNTSELPDGDENRFLPKIMSRLFEKHLVSEEDMSVFEGKLQMEKKTNIHENGNDIKNDDVDGALGPNNLMTKNPLQNSVVMKCVLQHLTFEEIKESRLISKEWASVGLNVLVPRSKITFDSSLQNGIGISERRSPINFFQLFSGPDEGQTLPFSQFTFCKQSTEDPWTLDELNYFFRNQQQYITHLELEDLYLVDNDWEKVDSFDITPWISNSPIATTNSETSTKLSIRIYSSEAVKLSIDSNALSNVKDLELQGCKVKLLGRIQISPINLIIQDSKFSRDGNLVEELCVNDFIDFRRAKKIELGCSGILSEIKTKLSLDLIGCHQLECLKLSNITLINCKTSNWVINELTLIGMKLTEETQLTKMKIKKLTLLLIQIDVSILPQSVETLNILVFREHVIMSTQPVVLDNLKCLTLHFSSVDDFSTFIQNVRCPNLIRICIQGSGTEIEMNLMWLSTTSVKILHLQGITIKNVESRNLNLDKLVLQNYHLSKIIEICSAQIQTKDLIISFPGTLMVGFYDEFSKFLENQKQFQCLGHRIYVCVDDDVVLMPKVEGPVDEYGGYKYYVFENNVGKGMTEEEFQKIMEWS